MKKLFALILLSVISLTAFAQLKKVAVYVIGDDTQSEFIQSAFVYSLTKSGKFTVVERSPEFLMALQKEISYQQSGAVDDKNIAQLGMQYGADYVCVIELYELFGQNCLAVRFINTRNAMLEANFYDCYYAKTIDFGKVDIICAELIHRVLQSKEGEKKMAVCVEGNTDVLSRDLENFLMHNYDILEEYRVVERSVKYAKSINDEQQYQRSGSVRDEDIIPMGELAGVEYVLFAKYIINNGYYCISARLINLETAEVVQSTITQPRKLDSYMAHFSMLVALHAQLQASEYTAQKQLLLQKGKEEAFAKIEQVVSIHNYQRGNYVYRGGMLNGKHFGMGVAKISDSDVYVGTWDEKKDGEGIYCVLLGEVDRVIRGGVDEAKVYVGGWKNGKPQGVGKYYDEVGKLLYFGEVKGEELIKEYEDSIDYESYRFEWKILSDSMIYVGETRDGERNGLGMLLINGHLCYGMWKDGKLTGHSMILHSNGSYGTYTMKNGQILSNEQYVDLGLPSGTKWAKRCQYGGFYTFEEALLVTYGFDANTEESMPSIAQWEELKKECVWEWQNDCYVVKGPNGNYIYLYDYNLIADYSRQHKPIKEKGGHFWTIELADAESSWEFSFDKDNRTIQKKPRKKKAGLHLVRVY